MPKKEKMLLNACQLRLILRLPRGSITRLRNVSIIALGTICALRPSEIMRLDVCDVIWNIDGAGTLALCLWYRKNDGPKRGLWPRVMEGAFQETCVLILLRLYMQAANLSISVDCTKKTWRASPCEKCGRFFRTTTAAGKTVRPATAPNHGISRATISEAVKMLLAEIGVDSGGHSGVSLRRGGISEALAEGIDEELRKIQSGHVSSMWTRYADITRRDQLYQFCRAFGT